MCTGLESVSGEYQRRAVRLSARIGPCSAVKATYGTRAAEGTRDSGTRPYLTLPGLVFARE